MSPLRVGGGIKVKVLEALCRGKAIVSTSIGAQGLGDGALIVADDAETFARAAAELVVDARARGALERRALAFAGTLPTWDDAAAALRDCYLALAETSDLADTEGARLR